MSKFSDARHLRTNQYRSSEKFDARVALHSCFGTNSQGWYSWLYEHLELPQSGNILELGTGPGNLWNEVSEQLPASAEIVLSDLSLGMLRASRRRLSSTSGNRYLASDIQFLPLVGRYFDVVIANHVLYHLADIERGIANIKRVLKPGGVFYAATNGISHLEEMWRWIDESIPGRKALDTFRTGIMGFSLENGAELLSRHFTQVELVYFPDALEITEVQPVVDYVSSSIMWNPPSKEELLELHGYLQHKLNSDGVLKVSKATGLFIAKNRD